MADNHHQFKAKDEVFRYREESREITFPDGSRQVVMVKVYCAQGDHEDRRPGDWLRRIFYVGHSRK